MQQPITMGLINSRLHLMSLEQRPLVLTNGQSHSVWGEVGAQNHPYENNGNGGQPGRAAIKLPISIACRP